MTTPETLAKLAARICLDVAELPDRNSPEDWPEAMLVTADELSDIVLSALTAQVPAAAWPSRDDLLLMLKLAKEASADPRRAGRAEALGIILALDPEGGLDDYAESSPMGDTGDYTTNWDRRKLAELLDCGLDNPVTSLLDRLEGAYWDALGRQADAEFKAAQQAAQAPEGWVLVPPEPTPEMRQACDTVIQGYGAKLVYTRMLAARPQAEGSPS